MRSVIQKQNSKTNSGLFLYLTILTALFLILQISFFLEVSNFYLGDIKTLANHISIPLKVVPPVLLFIFIQLLLHFLFVVTIWMQAHLIGAAINASYHTIEKIGFTLWGLTLTALVLANQYYFPNSKFACLTEGIFSHVIARDLLVILAVFLGITFFIALIGILRSLSITAIGSLIALGILLSINLGLPKTYPFIADAATVEKPNIIIIGLDSLRPDFLGYFGREQQTAHLDHFLNESTVFAESLTPIARTYPAWVSILTGKYPKQSGVRTNLQDQQALNLQHTLPNLLRQAGYKTIFATDETRFSNVDKPFGFDEVVTPSIGFEDFLLGTLNDFPFSNLLVNTSVGRWLFPYSYGNRPASATYDPDSFLGLLKPMLSEQRTKPLFLAVHFCLVHTPYIWGSEVVGDDDKPILSYQLAVARVDKQFNDFVKLLQQNNLLKHSIVIVLSDHGEALELPGDRATSADLFIAGKNNPKNIIPAFYPPVLEKEAVDESAGHGTDVLGLTQYHTVLAFRLFGLASNTKTVVPGRVSLLDIKPTVLDWLGMAYASESGNSLRKFILGKELAVNVNQHFFTESDFSPNAVRTVHPETRKVLFEGIQYFKLNPLTLRFTVRKNMEQMIFSSKQYADFYQQWVLALYPQNAQQMTPILVNLETGEWTNDLTSDFAKNSPAMIMLQALQNFYGSDITHVYL